MAGLASFPAWAAIPAAGIAAAAAVAGTLVWRSPAIDNPVAPQPAPPAIAKAAEPAKPVDAAKAGTAPPATAEVKIAALEAPAPPSFDIVRVEQTGDAVVAGRGAPGARIALMEGEKILAEGRIDPGGNFVLLPQNLGAGDHALGLEMRVEGKSPLPSSQSVTVVVAEKAKGGVVVARAEPGKATAILSDAPAARPAPGAPSVSIRTAEVDEGGAFYATGFAVAGATVRLYLNGSFITAIKANPAGQWSLKIAKGVTPGAYAVRADQVNPADGSVIARAEVPFDYEAPARARPATKTAAARTPVAPPAATVEGPAVVAQTPAVAPAPGKFGAPDAVVPPPRATLAAVEPPAAPAPKAPAAIAAPPSASVATKQIASGVPVVVKPAPAAVAAAPVVVDVPAVPPVSDAVIAEIQTATVARGDSLWRISRKLLGQGTRYTQIYEANARQIRNPKLIYPGQVFVLPNSPS